MRSVAPPVERIYRTPKNAYHVQDDVCVGVQDLQTRKFLTAHPALGHRLVYAIDRQGVRTFFRRDPPRLGQVLCFGFAAVTAPIEAIEEPEAGPVVYPRDSSIPADPIKKPKVPASHVGPGDAGRVIVVR